jgi:hypothetical protein
MAPGLPKNGFGSAVQSWSVLLFGFGLGAVGGVLHVVDHVLLVVRVIEQVENLSPESQLVENPLGGKRVMPIKRYKPEQIVTMLRQIE